MGKIGWCYKCNSESYWYRVWEQAKFINWSAEILTNIKQIRSLSAVLAEIFCGCREWNNEIHKHTCGLIRRIPWFYWV